MIFAYCVLGFVLGYWLGRTDGHRAERIIAEKEIDYWRGKWADSQVK